MPCFLNIGIPGLAALASLKRKRRAGKYRRSERDSGACCPGLIEAAGTDAIRPMERSGIPGLAALASLKQPKRHFLRPDLRKGIPGLAALASLKLPRRPEPVDPEQRDSGACCPGLIEAPPPRMYCIDSLRDSGACCPGLIEAKSDPILHGDRYQGIPGLAALASLKLSATPAVSFLTYGGFRGLLPWPH